MITAMLCGVGASLFFAATFVLNRQMHLGGGSWVWSAVLRFLFMLPMLWLLLRVRGEVKPVVARIRERPGVWILWSSVGFGVFYASLCYASVWGPSWLIAATWQITIVAGALLTPLYYETITTPQGPKRVRRTMPWRALALSSVVLVGIAVVQIQEAGSVSVQAALLGSGFVLVAAFAYPAGNRSMMELCAGRLSTMQRVFGMTLCSMPFWLLLTLAALLGLLGADAAGLPGREQAFQALLVALFSGVAATFLFFKATELVRHDAQRLAVVESTQAGELVFSVLGGVLLFGDRAPTPIAWAGLGLVVLGIILNGASTVQRRPVRGKRLSAPSDR
jgi:drug/metabolite transporter (DMT)-like permease